jgi:hypothetical protein
VQTKLTLTLDQDIIEQAKRYASAHGKSLSELVSNYFKFLVERKPETEQKQAITSERVKRLKGIIKLAPDFDYKGMLAAEKEAKYGQ